MSNNHDVDIRALAELARLDVTDEEIAKLENEIPDILAFVEQIKNAEVPENGNDDAAHRNVMREDVDPHEGGIHTDVLLNAAPVKEKGKIKVKQVIKKG